MASGIEGQKENDESNSKTFENNEEESKYDASTACPNAEDEMVLKCSPFDEIDNI